MELSLFLAKLLGLYMLILAIIAVLRKDQFLSVMKNMISMEGLVALSGAISLIIGLAILIGHPIWELNWRGLITLLGLIAVIQGIMRLGFTAQLQKAFSHEKLERSYWVIFAILFILGAFLTYIGFSHHFLS